MNKHEREAKVLGRLAFRDGRAMVPAHDKALMIMIGVVGKGHPFGSPGFGKVADTCIHLMDLWLEGWREAQSDHLAKENEAETGQ